MAIISKLMLGSFIIGSLAVVQGAQAQGAPPQAPKSQAGQAQDDELARKVKAVLNKNADLHADELRVHVDDGVAYISGQVSTPLETRDVRETVSKDIVANVPGIKKVIVQTSSAGE